MTCEGRFYQNGEDSYSVVFEDDGRVAYAYMLSPEGSIIGDVWLYNRCNTPKDPEWKSPQNMPFANSGAYVNKTIHDSQWPVKSIEDVRVEWSKEGQKRRAKIYIRECKCAVLEDGAKPGWSITAAKDGPLAQVLK